MKSYKLAVLAISCVLPLAATVSTADAKVFDWTLTGPASDKGGIPFPGGGQITAIESSTGVWDVDTITGTIDGSAITMLSNFGGADNLVYTNGFAFLDTSGISFETAAGQSVNIFSFFPQGTPPTANAYGELTASPSAFGVGTFTLSVPEPSAWALLLVGFAGLGFVGYHRSSSRKQRFFVPTA